MRRILSASVAVAALTLTACGGSSSGGSPADNPSGPLSGTITVFAAASLTESFTALGRQFESGHPGTTVRFNFGPSSGLATQIVNGAPADVFASASPKNMTQVSDAQAAGRSVVFATNTMEIAVPQGNPAKIDSVDDLARKGVKVVLCAATVPCGATARQVLANAKITVKAVSDEVDVKSTLQKVGLGEADAGVVYVTDVRSAGDEIEGVLIPDAVNASTDYPIATLTGSRNSALAQAFVDYVTSPAGRAELSEAGFTTR
ncbi:molybdate ABC transporter substrate-binding protein [Spongisporangium articulatum]|uniref:Molybdate ABC transporter substrate-binding protein n=1 Tax=Spongisporangium articulatum TaxID=3362603 RepID=A0ABW8ASH6_9ACTN